MFIPKITVKKTDLDVNVDFITELLVPEPGIENTSLPFKERVFLLLPELIDKITSSMTKDEVYTEVEYVIRDRLINNSSELDDRITFLQREFDKISIPFLSNLLDNFNIEWNTSSSEIICYVGCYPVFPRNVVTKEFWVDYKSEDERILRGTVHEINHFVVYEKWKSTHTNIKDSELYYPNPQWFLQEIIVDPTLNEENIQALVPYDHRAYEQFYKETIDGVIVMDRVKNFYNNRESIEGFLDTTYKFISDNISELIEKCG